MTAKWTPDMEAEFARLWVAGTPVEQLEKHFRIGHATLVEKRQALGLLKRVQGEWTPEREKLAFRFYISEGQSAAATARLIGGGLSRNAIIGVAHRRGWMRDARLKVSRPAATPRTPPRPGPQSKPAVAFGKLEVHTGDELERRRVVTAATGQAIAARFAAPANDDAIRLIDRRRFQCAWPVGVPDRPANQMCCGADVPEGGNPSVASYCPHHVGLALSRVLKSAPDAKLYERSMRRFA